MSVVEVRGLTKRFGPVVAVDGVGFEVADGEFFSLLGPSGCGKTTTLRCVAGLETAEEGLIRIGDAPVFASRRRIDVPTNRRAIGMVFQSYAVWPHMSVFENVAYPLRVRAVARAAIEERVARVLDILGMQGLGGRMPSQLSGGQQQRVALGRALAVEPKVLLLDEPLSNLDAKLREQMRAELKQVQRETGLPILYVTHDQTEALAMSDRIAVMNAGRIHQLAAPTEIYRRPATRFVLDFIGTVSYLPCRLDGAEGGLLTLELPDGQRLFLPRPGHVPPGPDALLALRPEDVRFVDGEGGLRGRILLRSFLGSGFEYRVRLGEAELRVQTGKHESREEGAEVGLAVREGLLLEPDAPARPDARAS